MVPSGLSSSTSVIGEGLRQRILKELGVIADLTRKPQGERGRLFVPRAGERPGVHIARPG